MAHSLVFLAPKIWELMQKNLGLLTTVKSAIRLEAVK